MTWDARPDAARALRSGQVKAGYYGHRVVGLSITRADMAPFLLDQAANLTYLHQVAYTGPGIRGAFSTAFVK